MAEERFTQLAAACCLRKQAVSSEGKNPLNCSNKKPSSRMNEFTSLQRCFADLLPKDLPNTPSYAPTSFLLFCHHSRRSLLLFLSPKHCKPLVLGFSHKLRSEAERSWFVYLSIASHAKQDSVPVQAAKRLCCCTETRMIQDETGSVFKPVLQAAHDRIKEQWGPDLVQLFSRHLLLLCRGEELPAKDFTAQLSSQELCSSPRGRLLQPYRSINLGTNAHFWRRGNV